MTVLIYPKLVNSSATDLSAYAVLPYTYQDTKDESLGSAQITLQGLKRKRPFKPYLRVDIDGAQWLIANDKVTVSLARKDLYKHELTLIEPTKLLELYMMGAKRFTRPSDKIYNFGEESGKSRRFTTASVCSSITDFGNPLANTLLQYQSSSITYTTGLIVYNIYDAEEENTISETCESGGDYGLRLCLLKMALDGITPAEILEDHQTTTSGETLSVELPQTEGQYAIWYRTTHDTHHQGTVNYGEHIYPISICSDTPASDYNTLKSISERLLDIVQPIKTNATPKFSLTTNAQTLLNVTAPEMSFTDGATLWENLSQIGKVIQARPKLIFDNNACKIDFERIGTRSEHSLANCQLVQNELSMNASEYANKVTATVSNMKNYDAGNLSLACEPSKDTFKSLRTNSETCRIKEEAGIIETDNPIEAIISLECLISSGGEEHTIDLTPYVYESTEYALLSSYSVCFPLSKIYAIYYTKGQNNIDGLWFRAQDNPIGLFNDFEQYTIGNIVERTSNIELSSSSYPNLMFRIKYISSVDGIVEQYTQNPSCSEDIAITTTQNTNEPNSTLLGKGLLGEAMMMGNVGESRTYISKSVSNLPTINNTIDGMFVTVATYQVFRNYALCTVNLTENYNELSAYNRISKEIRQYEIPNGQDRNFLMRSFLQIIPSNQATLSGYSGGSFANDYASTNLYNSLRSNQATYKVGNMVVTFKDDNGNTISEVTLPCMAIPVGNSIYFFGRCADNYAVGYKSQDSLATLGTSYRYTQAVRAGDQNYGRAKSIKIVLATDIAMASGHDTYNEKLSVAHAMPEKSSLVSYTPYADSGDILVWKDGAETLIIGWQMHFVSPSCIISPNLAYTLGFCNPMTHNARARLYFFSHELNPDLSNCSDSIGSSQISITKNLSPAWVRLTPTDTIPSHKSWALRDEHTNKWLVGENATFKGRLYFAFNDTYDYSENTISLT